MTRRRVAGLLALVVVVAGVFLIFFRHHGDATKPSAVAPPAPAADPWAHAGEKQDQKPQRGAIPQWTFDVDPEGPLRMKGKASDPDGTAVGGREATPGRGHRPPRKPRD